ncbi:hypothetical protein [Malikia sp.]|uniref:hypothetical protein n=1 Tax=Malikia sp. TaxID=2070706 RepID=UPI002630164F|nr:hypothetical protein [Malikia sp.]MDD2729302.1 hypothetical protein [Malikia sp.]
MSANHCINLIARVQPYGMAVLSNKAGLVSMWTASMEHPGQRLEITPDCARELAAALLAHAEAADQEGGAA